MCARDDDYYCSSHSAGANSRRLALLFLILIPYRVKGKTGKGRDASLLCRAFGIYTREIYLYIVNSEGRGKEEGEESEEKQTVFAARSRLRGTRHFSLSIIADNGDLAKSGRAKYIFFEDDEFSEI